MRDPLEDAYLAELANGALLVVRPKRAPQIVTEQERAVEILLRDGWDYFVTVHHSDTGDEYERWIPVHDERFDTDGER